MGLVRDAKFDGNDPASYSKFSKFDQCHTHYIAGENFARYACESIAEANEAKNLSMSSAMLKTNICKAGRQ